MFLYNEVQKREANQERVRVGLIGAGKFGSMFLSQVPFTIGLEVISIVDICVENAKKNCRDVGWTKEQIESVIFFDDLKKKYIRMLSNIADAVEEDRRKNKEENKK